MLACFWDMLTSDMLKKKARRFPWSMTWNACFEVYCKHKEKKRLIGWWQEWERCLKREGKERDWMNAGTDKWQNKEGGSQKNRPLSEADLSAGYGINHGSQ